MDPIMNKPAARISALSLSLMLLAGCATTSFTSAPESPAQSQALALIEQGKPRDAAMQLEGLAATLRGSARSNALADAAWAWHLAGDSTRARSLLGQLSARQLSGASLQRYQLTGAELALADKQPAQALALLKDNGDNVAPGLRTRWLLARAQALQATGDAFGAASDRARQLHRRMHPVDRHTTCRATASLAQIGKERHQLEPGQCACAPVTRRPPAHAPVLGPAQDERRQKTARDQSRHRAKRNRDCHR
jgi:outer membrane PBP1 activator LpoA protein